VAPKLTGSAPVWAAGAGTVLLLVGAALVPSALARPAYREVTVRQLGYPGSLLSRTTMPCTFCHVNERGGAPWNSFGEALKGELGRRPDVKFGTALHEVLSANGDSDGDGYADALEVFARTRPGDADSRPKEPETSLRARFEEAGGAAQYRVRPPTKPPSPAR